MNGLATSRFTVSAASKKSSVSRPVRIIAASAFAQASMVSTIVRQDAPWSFRHAAPSSIIPSLGDTYRASISPEATTSITGGIALVRNPASQTRHDFSPPDFSSVLRAW